MESPDSLSLSLVNIPNHLSLLVGPVDCIQCPHRADEYKSLLDSKQLFADVLESIRDHCS